MKTFLSIFLALFLATNVYGSSLTFSTDLSTATLDVEATDVTITNTTIETSIYSFSIPANELGTENRIRLVVLGQVNKGAGAGSFTLRFKYGATTLTSQSITVVSNATNEPYFIEGFLVGDDATNAQLGGTRTTRDATGVDIIFGTAAEDSTGALTLDLTVQLNAAAVGFTFLMKHAILTVAK